MGKVTVEALVEGGKATAGPPIGPALGPTGVNLYQVVQKINELTAKFKGLKVPVKITVDTDDKSFEVEVGVPPTSALILSKLGKEKATGSPGKEVTGDISMKDIVEIAKMKRSQLTAKTLAGAVRTVLGTCVSMGITVDGKDPRVVQKEVLEGKYDHLLVED
ncbi:MAG: 50S ribosomal protein L11 [Candidatus Jordarchaeales archaeon]